MTGTLAGTESTVSDLSPAERRNGRRVVLVLRHFTVGGLERVLLSHVRILRDHGFDIAVCLLDPGRDNALVTELEDELELVVLPRGRLNRIRELAKIVDGAVVLLQFGDGRLYPSLRPALRRARSVVRFCHSDYAHLRSSAKNRLDRFLSRGEDLVVAVGGRSTRFLTDDVGVPAAKVKTLVNAVEPRAVARRRPDWSWLDDPYLVAVQSLYPHKGHDALLRAFAEVVVDVPAARLVVIGDGSETIPLFRRARELGIGHRVTWLGAVWQQDIVDTVLSGAHAFVSMSRFEGVPISILEARRHGLPLILTDIAGHRDAVVDTATFVPVDDVHAFAKAAVEHLRLPSPARDVADANRILQEWSHYRDELVSVVDAAWSGTTNR